MRAGRMRWVLIAYRLPREPSTPRSALWRRLRRLGAVQLLDGLAALPLDARNREQLEWLAPEGGGAGGAACAWLIRRFLDSEAVFVFVDDPDEVPDDATPFDLRGVELSHHRGDCSFETFLRRYDLADPVLWTIAELVHEADLADDRYDVPEAPGLDVLVRGISLVREDDEVLALAAHLF